jgi:hypothetical protein
VSSLGSGPELEHDETRLLADALAALQAGQRERHRQLLARAIERATCALALAPTATAARSTLVKASRAMAQDALHGASQLSLSAQRAPTREACDEGWRRVEAIALGAEASARVAALTASELASHAPRSAVARAASAAARNAESAARAAQKLIEERNHAYTLHTDRGFSFGEGWYLAAAAVLAGITVQIEPGTDGTAQAERFLRDAGLASQLQPYRSRPRAMKHTTAIVARAFEADPTSATQRLRAAFLGEAPIPRSVIDWVERRLEAVAPHVSTRKKVLVWIRDGVHHPTRNTTLVELLELTTRVERAGLVPVLIGDALRDGRVPDGAIDMILFWHDPIFRQADMRRAQLQLFEHLKQRHGLVGQLGMTTAGMDGPALMGLPTLYLTALSNVRMREWVGAVPGYEEVVRESGYLERISRVLFAWAGAA